LVFVFSIVVSFRAHSLAVVHDGRSVLAWHSGAFVLLGVALGLHLASGDSYLGGQTSVWAAHDGHAVAIGALAGAGLVAGISAAAARWRHRLLVAFTGPLGAGTCALVALALMMFAGDN
jgi:hypothetical protein